MSKLSVDQFKNTLKKHFLYNKKLSERGFSPLSIRAVGPSGIGKTSSIEQCVKELSKELGTEIRWEKKNLANISDTGDLVGYPKTKTLIRKTVDGQTYEKWVWDDTLDNYKDWEITTNTTTGYAPPDWVEYLSNGGILLLDDYNRASMRMMQAIMDIIDRREFYSWRLPDDVLIVLTGNPSGENYIVSEEDKAQTTRYITYEVDFNFDCWRNWAIQNGIKEEFIEFIAINHEELFAKDDSSDTNIRQWSKLFILASVVNDLDDEFFGNFIQACVGDKNSHMFIDHLNEINKIDITGEEILTAKKYDTIKNKIRNLIVTKENYYRNSVASIILDRIIGYIISEAAKTENIDSQLKMIVKLFSDNIFKKEAIYVLVTQLKKTSSKALNKLIDDDNFLELTSNYSGE